MGDSLKWAAEQEEEREYEQRCARSKKLAEALTRWRNDRVLTTIESIQDELNELDKTARLSRDERRSLDSALREVKFLLEASKE